MPLSRGERNLPPKIDWWLLNSLALLEVLLALVSAEEELPVEELYGYHSEDEVEEEVDHQDVEHILERVDHTVEDGLELGHALDRLQGPEHAQHAQGLHRGQVLTTCAPPGRNRKSRN